MRRIGLVCGLFFVMLAGGGCSTHPTRGNWGEQATLSPGWQRIKRAAYHAAVDPATWAPALGAALFTVSGLDKDTAEWAVRHQPLFGDDAGDWSDDLRSVTTLAYAATALAASSGDDDWLVNKAKGIGVGLAAIGISDGIVFGLKDAIGRDRPDDSDDESFPSAHASMAATRVALASRNLDYIEMPDAARTALNVGLYTVAFGTAWARVEAEKHYPSDVLAGMAIGNFVATFVNDAFLEPGRWDGPLVSVQPLPRGGMLTLQLPLH